MVVVSIRFKLLANACQFLCMLSAMLLSVVSKRVRCVFNVFQCVFKAVHEMYLCFKVCLCVVNAC